MRLYQSSLAPVLALIAGASVGRLAIGNEPIPCEPEAWAAAEIARFEKEDRMMPPPKAGILFLGSSSIRGWALKKWFPELPVINRGYGGSHICHSTHYADRLVTIHRPRLVVFYAGDNDIAAGNSPEQVRDDFRAFVEKVRKPQPDLPIVFISIKPSIARWKLADEIKEANRLIAADAEELGSIKYLDVWPAMLDDAGQPRKDVFVDDGLHLNDAGYDVWAKLLRPHLEPGDKEEK